MRKSKKQKAAVPPESVVSDRTPVREKFWSDIGVAITSATQHGVLACCHHCRHADCCEQHRSHLRS